MSESGSELKDYTYTSFSSAIRGIGPFLDANMTPSDESEPNCICSQSTQSDECHGKLLPTTSTPDLSFVTSSSPNWSSARESPPSRITSSDCPLYRNAVPVFKPTSDHASFSRRSNHVLRNAADQQRYYRASERPRIQPDSAGGAPGPRSQLVSTAHDAVTESVPTDHGFYSSTSPRQGLQRPPSLVGGTSGDDTIPPVSKSAGNRSKRNKRKASATHDECFKTPAMAFTKDEGPSDVHFSASGGAALILSCCRNVSHPSSKKQKHDALDNPLLSVASACADSRALTNKNLIHSNSSPVSTIERSSFNATHDASKVFLYDSNLHLTHCIG
ncbi:hypothetical protein BC827DRAFT_820078 [Russula dissimulans]|nr:hypothetical protein BC827DRAFT_820078 [Russula dissimulans]